MRKASELVRKILPPLIGRTPGLLPVVLATLRLNKSFGHLLKSVLAANARNSGTALDQEHLARIETINDAVEFCLLFQHEPIPFLVPASRAVWGYGFRHTADEHPWIAHLQSSDAKLKDFYATYQPVDVHQAFNPSVMPKGRLEAEIGKTRVISMSESHWLSSDRFGVLPSEFMGEETNGRFMGREHGVQHHGPVSLEKVTATSEALFRVHESLKRNGYRPDFGGWIRGNFLFHGEEYLFLICGGQHRAAAWVALGHETIPVIFQPGYPRVVDTNRLVGVDRAMAMSYFDDSFREARRRLIGEL